MVGIIGPNGVGMANSTDPTVIYHYSGQKMVSSDDGILVIANGGSLSTPHRNMRLSLLWQVVALPA